MHPRRHHRLLLVLLLAATLGLVIGTPGAAAAHPTAAPRLTGGFAEFWQAHNGALLFGAPLTDELVQDGVTVQYFERGRLEWHREQPPGRQILVGRLGVSLVRGRTFPGIAAFASNPGHRYFAATGHSVQGAFLRFWEAQGGLEIFGYPLSQEVVEDGRTVQYFERARLEHHPELAAAGYDVLPSPLGGILLATREPAIVVEPPVVQEGHTALIKVVSAEQPTVVGGTLGGRPLAFSCCLAAPIPGAQLAPPWALAGVEPDGEPPTLPLRITLRYDDGRTATVERQVPVRRYPYPTRRTPVTDNPITPNQRNTERVIVGGIIAGREGTPRWDGRFAPPLEGTLRVTSQYGERRATGPNSPNVVHAGLDLAAPMGTPVYAPAPGRVALVQPLTLRGNAIMINHGAGVFTLYAHLSAFRVVPGQEVQTGDLLGLVGSTGNSSGPHLHWEIHVAGVAVRPQEWLTRTFP